MQQDWNNDGTGDKCQDSDGDTFRDDIDQCVNISGIILGCPDPCEQIECPQDYFCNENQDCELDPQLECGELTPCVQAGFDCRNNICVLVDQDSDGVTDGQDNCPQTANSNQSDSDGDGMGDLCDNCPSLPCTANQRCASGMCYSAGEYVIRYCPDTNSGRYTNDYVGKISYGYSNGQGWVSVQADSQEVAPGNCSLHLVPVEATDLVHVDWMNPNTGEWGGGTIGLREAQVNGEPVAIYEFNQGHGYPLLQIQR
ncbi:thrombospondin type 3 repeat-containing protein [Patescibacteria group bacterium]|nr:thrombospondin type 3 repeat-containing protein [Patescibacteria group bacterium]MBU1721502.1 thrombospondin type 3 repeat-containing protein [Patescibacteria group bacterium]MBU1900926.1 thrombospondin type 3 repeat-containing protein [Patescibacteria group bacterium]